MKVSKTHTKTYDIYESVEWESTFGETMEIRNKTFGSKHDKFLEKCFVCGHKFENSEVPWLGLVRNHKNVFLCEDCGKKVQDGKID